MRSAIVLSLVLALLPSDLSARTDLRAQLQAIPADTPLQVKLKSKEELRGLKGAVTEDGFVLRVSASGAAQDRRIAFQDTKTVKRLDKQSHKARNVAIVVAVGLGALVIAAVVAFKTQPLLSLGHF